MQTYPPFLAVDDAQNRPIANMLAEVVDAETSAPVQVYRDGAPLAALVTGPNGVVATFQTEDTTRLVEVRVGSVVMVLSSLEAIAKAASGEAAAAEADRASAEADRAASALTAIDDAGIVRGARLAEARDETAWAQTTSEGHRLPLGYAPDGTLDRYARAAWLRDLDDARDGVDPQWARVRATPDGRIIYGERWDGSVVIPGLVLPAGAGGGTSAPPVSVAVPSGGEGVVLDTAGYGAATRPARVDMTRVALWGSSSMRLLGDTTAPAWAAEHGMALLKGGQGSERIAQTAARQGGDPARLTFPDGMVPASGSVPVTPAEGQRLDVTPQYMRAFTGYVTTTEGERIAGTLSGTVDGLAWTRATAGAVAPVEDGVKMVPDLGEEWANSLQIIQAGKNDHAVPDLQTPGRLVGIRLAMTAHQPALTKRVLMVGDFVNSNSTTSAAAALRAINAATKVAFGPVFVDVEEWLASEQVWDDCGVSPTTADRDAQARRVIPPSLSLDPGHLNATGNAGYIKLIDRHLTGLGWL